MAVSVRCSTDHHGALVAPPGFDAATATPAQVDDAIRRLLELQQDHWLSIRTDGELRRLGGGPIDVVAEARFLTSETEGVIKIRVPRTVDGAIADRATLDTLIELGVAYLELDGSAYAPLVHRASRAEIAAAGTDPDAVLRELLARDAAVLAPLSLPEGVKLAVCLHDPTGPSGPAFGDDLDEASARTLFETLPATRYLIDGGPLPASDYGFLAWLPDTVEIALCLIETRTERVQDAELILDEVLRAAAVVGEDRLAISTRHAFRVEPGAEPREAWDHMRAVLTMHLDAATRVWGIDF